MACEKETKGKDTFEPMANQKLLDMNMIQKVMFDETFGPDEGNDDNYSSQDEMLIGFNPQQLSCYFYKQIVCFVWHA